MWTCLKLSCVGVLVATSSVAQSNEKLSDDPTKVITKVGIRYADDTTVYGSIAFGPVTKINARATDNGDWSIGGSYLFKFGIVNVSGSKKVFENDVNQNQYSIGTFIPLSALGIKPAGWQLFTALGYNYTEGEYPYFDPESFEFSTITSTSQGGYLGLMALKSINPKWTFKAGVVAAKGSNDYSGLGGGAGLTYNFTPKDSFGINASYIDNSFGSRELYGVSYTHEF